MHQLEMLATDTSSVTQYTSLLMMHRMVVVTLNALTTVFTTI
jgi:hypothetical protein